MKISYTDIEPVFCVPDVASFSGFSSMIASSVYSEVYIDQAHMFTYIDI
jgi:glycerol dehydrogenase-like iron-containing ADH family enzyme